MLKQCVLCVLFGMSVCAWIAGQLLDKLDVTIDRRTENHPRSGVGPFPDNKMDNLHWFVQLSDIHISRYMDFKRGPDFQDFCTRYIDVIRPEVVLVSGDLTDAKDSDKQGSRQYRDEWEGYQSVLAASKVTDKTVWLDIRGNHDAFNVPSLTSKQNYFREYSEQGKKNHQHSYRYVHKVKGGQIGFIAVDACPDPGPRRPFNFFGLLSEDRMRDMERFAAESKHDNMTIWFGHYPSSLIHSASTGIHNLLSQGTVYLPGHLHTLGGFVPQMYTMHKAGNLELECGDWKDNRIFRVFASDHDLFSFTDEVYSGTNQKWPVILVTNPKHALFNMPYHEPTGRMLHSTHIRVLVFAPGKVDSVLIKVDDIELGSARHVEGPLYMLPWQPKSYATGVHKIEVSAKDSHGHSRTISQPFSLDNSKLEFKLLAKLALMINHSVLLKSVFVLCFLAAVVPLLLLYFFKYKITVCPSGGLLSYLVNTILMQLHLVAQTKSVLVPVILFAIYVAIGPWFVGGIIDGHIGICFVWGVYVRGVLLQMNLTYFYAILQYVTFNIPLTFYLGHCVKVSHTGGQMAPNSPRGWLCWVWNHWPFVLLEVWQTYMALSGFLRSYGTMAFFIGPVRTWSVFIAWWLRRRALAAGKDFSSTLRKQLQEMHEHDPYK